MSALKRKPTREIAFEDRGVAIANVLTAKNCKARPLNRSQAEAAFEALKFSV